MQKIAAEQVRPVRDFVLIKPHPNPEKTAGGILIPKTARDRTQLGTVLRTGPGRVLESGKRVEPEVRAGDVVLYLENTIAQRINAAHGDGDPLLLPEVEVIAVVEGVEPCR
jgi:chaperonin GroES